MRGDAVPDGELKAVGVPPAGITHFKFRWFKVVPQSDGGEQLDRLWDCVGARYSPTEADAGHKIRVHALPKRDGGGFGRPMEATSETIVSSALVQAAPSLGMTSASVTKEHASAPFDITAFGGEQDVGTAQTDFGVFGAFGDAAAPTDIPQVDVTAASISSDKRSPPADIFGLVASADPSTVATPVTATLSSSQASEFDVGEDAFTRVGAASASGTSGPDADDEFGDFGDFGGADAADAATLPVASEVVASPAPPITTPVLTTPVDSFDFSSSLAAPAPPPRVPPSFADSSSIEHGEAAAASGAAGVASFENDDDDFGDFGDFDGAQPALDKVDEAPVEGVDRTAALSLSLFGDEDAESPGVRLRRLSDDGGGTVDIAEYVDAWVALGGSVADMLEQSTAVWKETVLSGHELAMQKNHQGQQWLAALTRVSFVAHCLEGALRHHGMAASSPRKEDAERWIERIRTALTAAEAPHNLSPSLMDASHAAAAAVALPGGLDPWSDSRAQIQRVTEAASALGNDAGRQPRVPHCSLSLLPLAPLKSVSVVEWEGRRSCLAPIANWWANRCNEVPLPHLD